MLLCGRNLSTGRVYRIYWPGRADLYCPLYPCIDLGWRLKRSAWNRGYATEGARACLQWAFEELNLPRVYALAPEANHRSIAVMQRWACSR
nr:GNAT family N-acetyltransferase [Cesiribacter andamanensis]